MVETWNRCEDTSPGKARAASVAAGPFSLPRGATARACSGWTVGLDGGSSSAARWRCRWHAWNGSRQAAVRGRSRRWLVAALGDWALSGPRWAERITAPTKAKAGNAQ
jgi:hypothetical protein